jgi:hypothetical protein
MDLWDKFLSLLRQPEMILAIATVLFTVVRALVPDLQDYVTIEFLIALLTVLLGGGAMRYVKRSRLGPS